MAVSNNWPTSNICLFTHLLTHQKRAAIPPGGTLGKARRLTSQADTHKKEMCMRRVLKLLLCVSSSALLEWAAAQTFGVDLHGEGPGRPG